MRSRTHTYIYISTDESWLLNNSCLTQISFSPKYQTEQNMNQFPSRISVSQEANIYVRCFIEEHLLHYSLCSVFSADRICCAFFWFKQILNKPSLDQSRIVIQAESYSEISVIKCITNLFLCIISKIF